DPETSTLPRELFSSPYPRMAADLYLHLLDMLPDLVADPSKFRSLWEAEDGRLSESEQLVKSGVISIAEEPGLDFAVVRLPQPMPSGRVHRFASAQTEECHPLAIYNTTSCTRILLQQGQHIEFQYRYEGWVQLVSRRPAARIDLSDLAAELNLE